MTIHPMDEEAFQTIDAAMFSGCPDEEFLQRLEYFMGRWSRQIPSSRETNAVVEEDITYDLYGYASDADFENGRNREHLGTYESMFDALFEGRYYLEGGVAWGEPRAVIKAISTDSEEIQIFHRGRFPSDSAELRKQLDGNSLTLCPYHQEGLGWDACSDWFRGECQVEEARKRKDAENE